MDSHCRHLEEQLQRRELETSELRRSLHELRTKFVQLERAFEINLQRQRQGEVELNHVKHESQELRKLNEETLIERTEVSSRLMDAVNERDHWKNAYLQQKEFIKRCKMDYDNAVGSVKKECEDILKMTRETTERQFQELIQLLNGARDKADRLEEQAETYQIYRRGYENRSFELANLLETLKRFDVNVSTVCQLVAEALKNLTEQGNLFEENLKNLRHLAWTTKDRKDDSELVLLRNQNFVLKEVVKNLKRKMLNSEKRAIERSLCNLERTVAALKFNALDQARSMIGKGSQFNGNDEFFECIRALTQ